MVDIPINDLTPRNRYVAAGGETEFDYTFPIFDADHIQVQMTDPSDLNNPDTLVRGVDYNVTDVGAAAGGTIQLLAGVYPSGATAADIFTLTRVMPYERLNDYQFSGDFESGDVNNDFDVAIMLIQQLNRLLNSTARLDQTDSLTALPIEVQTAADRMDRALMFNSTGDGLTAGPTAVDIVNAGPAAATAVAAAAEAEDLRDQTLIYRNEAQAAAAGMKRKTPARAATTGALPSCTYANGASGVGATLTATANGALASQDGVALLAGEALLVKNQASTQHNGIYVVTQLGTAGTPFILTRQTDSDTWAEIVAALVTVAEGSTLADTDFLCTSNAGGTMGTTAITWQQQNSVIADGAVSSAAKIANNIITYAKVLSTEFALTSDLIAGTAGKFVNAANLRTLLAGGMPIQSVRTTTTASTSTTSAIPRDTTIPQNTEGVNIPSLDTTFTPKHASSILIIDVFIPIVDVGGLTSAAIALFQDAIANALAVSAVYPTGGGYNQQLTLRYVVAAGSTTARTYKINFGPDGAGGHAAYFNRAVSSATLYGMPLQASMTVTEYAQ